GDERRLRLLDPAQAPRGRGFLAWMGFAIGPYRWKFWLVTLVMVARHTVASAIPMFFSYFVALVAAGGLGFGEAMTLAAPYLVIFGLFLAGVVVLYPQLTMVDLAMRGLGMYALDRMIAMDTAWHEDKASGAKGQKINKGRESFKILLDSFFW